MRGCNESYVRCWCSDILWIRWLMCSSQTREDTNSDSGANAVQRDVFLQRHPPAPHTVSLKPVSCHSRDTLPRTKMIKYVQHLHSECVQTLHVWREPLSKSFLCHLSACNYPCVPVCASFHKLSQIIYIFSSPMWEAHSKPINGSAAVQTAAPCFPPQRCIAATVTLLSNLEGALLGPETPESCKTLSGSLLYN